ncbi:alpha/beta hydrolase [Lacticaseibacillus saniviri]
MAVRFRQPQPIHYSGTKAGVVLLHAYTGSPNDMNKIAHRLQEAGYAVSAPLFAGHGTDNPLDILQQGNPELWWQQTQAAIADMKQTYEQVFVFGLSLGGIFAMRALTEDHTLAGGGVFSSPIFSGKDNLLPGFLRYAAYIDRLAGRDDQSNRIKALLPAQLDAIKQVATLVAQHLPAITQPVFIAQAGADELIDANQAYTLKAALPQVPVDFHWYANARHVITVNAAHHELTKDVLNYLKQEEVPV